MAPDFGEALHYEMVGLLACLSRVVVRAAILSELWERVQVIECCHGAYEDVV